MQIKPIVVVVNRVKDWGRVVAGSDDLGTWESVISLRSKGFKSAISVSSVTDLLEWSIESWGDFVVQSSKNQKKQQSLVLEVCVSSKWHVLGFSPAAISSPCDDNLYNYDDRSVQCVLQCVRVAVWILLAVLVQPRACIRIATP